MLKSMFTINDIAKTDKNESQLPMSKKDEHWLKVVIIDNGSHMLKIGYRGNDSPSHLVPTLIAHSKHEKQSYFVGDEANRLKNERNNSFIVRSPLERGIVSHLDDMEKIWHHAFYNELKVDIKEYVIVISEPPLIPKAARRRMYVLFFETFEVAGCLIICASKEIFNAFGTKSGLVIDSGHEVTTVAPVYDGYLLPHAIFNLNLAGRHITEYLEKLITQRYKECGQSKSFLSSDYVNDLKEKFCFVSENMKFNQSAVKEKSRTVRGDSEVQKITEFEKCQAPELLFNPSLNKIKSIDTVTAIGICIKKCDSVARKEIAGNILLLGGTTMLKGFAKRISNELAKRNDYKYDFLVFPEARLGSWFGLSAFATEINVTNHRGYMSKDDYEESGPSYAYHPHR